MTELQQKTYEWVRLYIVEQGIAPKLDEIAEHFGVSKITIHERINRLVEQGKLVRDKHRARNLRLPDICPTCGQQWCCHKKGVARAGK